jgi:hypothetical protein
VPTVGVAGAVGIAVESGVFVATGRSATLTTVDAEVTVEVAAAMFEVPCACAAEITSAAAWVRT